MSSYTPDSVAHLIGTSGMIPVFYHADIEVAKSVLDACYRGGVRVFEFTNRGGNAFDVFTALLKHVEQYSDMLLGIGTILDGTTAKKFIDAGAHFIVSPILKADMATVCQEHTKLWIPGCATLTEIVTAKELGAQVIKIFPGSVLGPDFVSSVLPVVPGLQLMPTGGVEPTEESLSAWFKAGVVCVGMGSKLMIKKPDGSFDLEGIENKAREAIAIISKFKK
jgi:2-dehydro-3-deoxyphosphogluconate aldolase / (4S)-4-hydroxy-2-oxoglutarate aldolase